jgi:hypothetical protein
MRQHGLAGLLLFTLIGALVILSSTFSIDKASTTTLLWDFTPTAFSYLPNVQKKYQPFPVVCTPPACEEDEVYYCPGECPGGCGTECATPTPTNTPTLPPPSFDNCQEDPDPSSAGNYPVRIVNVYKAANPEVVRLENVSSSTVNLTGWHMCSITCNQEHDGISGTLAPGQTKDFPHTGSDFIWNNSERDDGALYNAEGQLVSYWIDS